MKPNKKFIALVCGLALPFGLLAGCAGSGASSSTSSASSAPQSSSSVDSAASSAASSQRTNDVKTTVRVGTLQGPTGIGMVKLMEDASAKKTANAYQFTVAGAPDEISGKLVSGELDIAALPSNMAAVLYNKTQGGVKLIGVNTLGVLYLLQAPAPAKEGEERAIPEEDAINSVADLAGKTIYSTGQGATPEYILNYLLAKNGVTDAQIIYKAEHAELAALMSEGAAELALLPQPFATTVTMKDDSIRTALDITKEWQAVSGGTQLTMGVIVVRSDFLDKNKSAVDAFLAEYEQSAAFVNADVAQAAALSEKYDIIKEQVAKLAIPHCNIVSIQGAEMKQSASAFLKVLFDADPKSVGGALPDEPFYYVP